MNISDIVFDNRHRQTYCECMMDLNFILLNGNDAFYDLVGKNSVYKFTYCIHPDDVAEFEAACKHVYETGDVAVLISRYHGEEDFYQVYEVTIRRNVSPEGEIRGYDVELLDILRVKTVYRRNMNNVRKYRSYMSMISVYYFEYGMDTNTFKVFSYINGKSIPIVDEPLDTWYETAREMITAEKDGVALDKLRNALKNGIADFNVHISGAFFSKNGIFEELICMGKQIDLQSNRYVFGIIKNAEGDIERGLAYYFTEAGKDSATGLFNKRASLEYSKEILAEGGNDKHYMIVLDIDDFKDYNDNYGHAFGDDVILTVARTLSKNIGIRGMVGRIGGDEFYALTDNIDTEKDLRVILKTISKNLYYAYNNENEDIHVTVSMGVACYPDDGTDYNTLFKKADKALYIAKEKGKNRFIIYDEGKHGAVTDDIEGLEVFRPTFKAEACANMISNLMLKLNSKGTAAINEVFDTIKTTFDIDNIQIVSEEGKVLYTDSNDNSCIKDFSFFKIPDYLRFYNEFFVYAENNVQNMERFSKETYDIINASGVISFFHVAYPDTDAPKLFVCYNIFKGKRKWSEDDKNFLMILSRMLLGVVAKEI